MLGGFDSQILLCGYLATLRNYPARAVQPPSGSRKKWVNPVMAHFFCILVCPCLGAITVGGTDLRNRSLSYDQTLFSPLMRVENVPSMNPRIGRTFMP